ncbi:MAG: alpha/beta fold hydrolase [Deltaproteobacteria bacterium]|nr:alpha/beta fold hydrolase [Deltaproteobacteria bacterium]
MTLMTRIATENSFEASDGEKIFYRHWPARGGGGGNGILLFHRGHEHSGRLQHVVDKLDLPDFHMFAWDARGHGRSPGLRGYAENFGVLEKDADCFVRHVACTHGISIDDIAIIAQSVGSVLIAAWVHDFAPKIRCMVLAAPALKVKLYVPLAIPGLRLLQRIKKPAFVKSYVKAKFLTHDAAQIASYENDPLISRSIAVNILLDLFDTSQRLIADAAAIYTPTQMLISGADWVVHQEPQREFFQRLGSAVKEKHEFAGFYHDTLNEKDSHLAIGKAREFILRQFAKPLMLPDLCAADRSGHTKKEYDLLTRPLAPLSAKALGFATTRLSMRTLGRLSDGIRGSLKSGFDSGAALDYVYKNQVSGHTPIGRLIDGSYLNSAGWRGIRQRKAHLERAIRETAQKVEQAGAPLRFLDVAAGQGRYLLNVLQSFNGASYEALLRDFDPANVEQGRKLAAHNGFANRVRFEVADAFDRASLARVTPRPTLVIVSGLYELFPDNPPVQNSLAGIAEAMEPGGFLIYTNQPWHPQLELIARTLTSHRGGARWIMRRRTQLEMDQLVEAVGFVKAEQFIDQWGMFSVSVARKGSP